MKTEEIRLLPLGLILFILKLYDSPGKRGFAESKKEGAYSKQAHRIHGWVVPAGKENRRIRWELARKFSSSEISLMRQLTNKRR